MCMRSYQDFNAFISNGVVRCRQLFRRKMLKRSRFRSRFCSEISKSRARVRTQANSAVVACVRVARVCRPGGLCPSGLLVLARCLLQVLRQRLWRRVDHSIERGNEQGQTDISRHSAQVGRLRHARWGVSDSQQRPASPLNSHPHRYTLWSSNSHNAFKTTDDGSARVKRCVSCSFCCCWR